MLTTLSNIKESASKRSLGYKNLVLSCVLTMCYVGHSFAFIQQSDTEVSSFECTQVGLEGQNPALMTKAERIAALENSLSDSIDSYSTCVGAAQNAMAGGGAGQGKGTGAGSGSGSGEFSSDTVAGDGSSGQELQQIPEQSQVQQQTEKQMTTGNTNAPRGIIAPKDNDKIICKLLFQEITKTKDAGMLAGLKKQYQNYKCG